MQIVRIDTNGAQTVFGRRGYKRRSGSVFPEAASCGDAASVAARSRRRKRGN